MNVITVSKSERQIHRGDSMHQEDEKLHRTWDNKPLMSPRIQGISA